MATVYYDFSATTNGSGTLASPKNTWTAPSNGDVIRLKRGTTFRSGQLNLSQSSLTFEAWYNADGSDDMLQPKPIITVQLTAGSGGINMTGTGTHVWRNIVFKDFLNTNTPTGNTPNALVLSSTGTYDYNVFYNTTNPYLDNSSAAISNGANDLVTNPLFISGSYKLNSSSPAKSTGTFVAYNRDLDNIPFSNPPSRGAFTYFART